MTKSFPLFHQAKVAVLGDVMLDRYYYGDVQRISPEAPVPVVNVKRQQILPGGAANVAMNLSALGAEVGLAALVGDDENAKHLQTKLDSLDVACAFNTAATNTIVKSRVLGGKQQLLRMDFEERFEPEHWSATWQQTQSIIGDAKVLVLSDYNKGTLADCQQAISWCRENNISVLVDPKGSDFSKYAGANLLTPNLSEFIAVAGEFDSEYELQEKAHDLIERYNLGALLVTRSEQGMSLFRAGEEEFHLPAITREVADVTGAGDTVIATIAAAIATGCDLELAVTLSNLAAGVVVGKVGAAAITAPELELEYHKHHQHDGSLSYEQLLLAVKLAKKRGEKVVFTNGCFDILHAGHVKYLKQARALGDRLIVAINSDDSVKRLKGEGRPVNSVDRRLAVLQGLESVDWVSCFEGDTPNALLEELQPDILVKGGDYSKDQVVGKDIVEAYGGEVNVMSLVPECSTTRIIEKSKSIS